MKPLPFEAPIDELYSKIDELKRLSEEGQLDLNDEIARIQERAEKMKKEIFESLSPSQIIQIARHPNRPDSLALCQLIFDDFIELHGDRQFRDDPSMIAGIGNIGNQRLVAIGHQKGHDTKEKLHRNFGMPHPEGYRKALRFMKMAEKFNMPIITFVDTPGAYPGKEAEERGQAEAIARNLREMAGLTVPIITFVIGEGGSGGALGIAVSNKIYMLQYSVYSVISPEGCASILFRDANLAEYAAERLKITATDIEGIGIADGVLPEPMGGAHNDWPVMADRMKSTILSELKHYSKMKTDKIVEERYQKFRNFGVFEDLK